jgi:ABC-type multidrug transport system ATPase subunit
MKLELRAVSKAYGRLQALDRVSMEVLPGQIVALLGANGAGKTTLLRCLAGISSPDSGAILYDDLPFERDNIALRRRLFFLPDFPVLFQEMSVLRHIGMVLRLYGNDTAGIENRVVELLNDFDLLPLAEAALHSLSRGQIYKAALSALIAVNPEIWLLDEPLASGMDAHGIDAFKRHAREAAKNGRTIIYTTQILEVVERFSDRVAILDQAELKAFAPVSVLEHSPPGSLEEVFRQLRSQEA